MFLLYLKTQKSKWLFLRILLIRKKELARFSIPLFLDSHSCCIFCLCFKHCFHRPLHSGFHYLFGINPWAYCHRKGYLPSLICSKTDIHLGTWSRELIQKKTTLDEKTKLTFPSHHLPDRIYHKAIWRLVASTMNKTAMHFFRIPLGETLTQINWIQLQPKGSLSSVVSFTYLHYL